MTTQSRLDGLITDLEMAHLMGRSNVRAVRMVGANWALIAGAFALVGTWPSPITALAAVLVLGGRQLGLAVLNHDCAHYVLFDNRRLNEWVGHWLCGGPLHISVYAYRAYHLKHHRFAGTENDPDLALALTYPTTPASMRRKLTRDLTGRTGLKDLRRIFGRRELSRHLPFVVSHAVMLGALTLAGTAWLYALWWAAWFTTYQLVTRIRFMSEHGIARDRRAADPRDNTCTTLIRWWERLLIGPNFVNYHLEHHLSAGVPCYNLPAMHRLLARRGYHQDKPGCLTDGYLEVVRQAMGRRLGPSPQPA